MKDPREILITVDRVSIHDLLIYYQNVAYRGSSTVWHRISDGKRCHTPLEAKLCDIATQYEWWENDGKPEAPPYPTREQALAQGTIKDITIQMKERGRKAGNTLAWYMAIAFIAFFVYYNMTN